MAEVIAALVIGAILIGVLIRWLVSESKTGAVAQHRGDALDANLEATTNAERHLDIDLTVSARARRAARRRLRRQARAAELQDSKTATDHDRDGRS
jgi:type II secretory pathway component PulJ